MVIASLRVPHGHHAPQAPAAVVHSVAARPAPAKPAAMRITVGQAAYSCTAVIPKAAKRR